MGFPYVAIKMAKSLNFLFLLCHFKSMLMAALAYLGLFNTPQDSQLTYSEEFLTSYVFLDWPTPSLVPIPVHILMASIKKRLPVVEYCEVLKRFSMCEDEDTVCSVCLSCIERRHEVRELCNCSHVFHRECLDNWVDVGQVTCPLCRSMLFPAMEDLTSCGASHILTNN